MSTPTASATPVTPESLLDLLASKNYSVSTVRHPAVFTVEESTPVHASLEGGHTKNLFLKDKRSRLYLVTAEHDTVIDLKGLHRVIGASGRLSFGNSDRLLEYLGVAPGSVTPFSLVNDTDCSVRFFMDERLLRHDFINCHPLTNEATTTIRRDDLLSFIRDTGHDVTILNF